ncbi:hypothetical protein M409DRAFT_66997 [Zasmidium cellare ATCC 36951]|uniref:FAD dependent oxidoreductase domain-containing protein n=1 Tax=Zasmidium cellare ATCC 36951 TaxID=1080233 RepID=A0A6A6CHD1_ZASCE|nr:uncharacterized protein M409DRAFT_66997 [Zasmidium cellare ATCC 36951]KAF2165580.1 hypothetical protein M409DRAFT_66997 [Zasmidium cellare ATCC 36951]
MPSHESEIIIVGAGVFGLSAALWLARDGYQKITVYDRTDYDATNYDPANGCSAASADINKIFRTAYGDQQEYQDLAIEARDMWMAWNEQIAGAKEAELPKPLTPHDKLLEECGVYYLSSGEGKLTSHFQQSLDTLAETAPSIRQRIYLKGDQEEEKRLATEMDAKWKAKYHIADKLAGGSSHGFLDTSGGVTYAYKACMYAKHLCSQSGVQFVLGDSQGRLKRLAKDRNTGKVIGITTCDDKLHLATLVILACGSWTASVLPEAHRTVEATTGSVMYIDVPADRRDIRQKFSPENFPVWHYRRGQQGDDGYYEGGGFPITSDGRLKFGFRGRKLTNFQDHPFQTALRVSMPWTDGADKFLKTVPKYNLDLQKQVIAEVFPELAEFGFTDSRLCWYTDSPDNSFVIDYVPGYGDSLFICTGGSGHGFKFLPILGRYVKNQIEHNHDQFTQMWKWRSAVAGEPCNHLNEGESRDIKAIQMASAKDYRFDSVCERLGVVEAEV